MLLCHRQRLLCPAQLFWPKTAQVPVDAQRPDPVYDAFVVLRQPFERVARLLVDCLDTLPILSVFIYQAAIVRIMAVGGVLRHVRAGGIGDYLVQG